MVAAWIQRGTTQLDGMESEELLRGVVEYAVSVQSADVFDEEASGTQASPGRMYPFDIQDPCDEAMIGAILERHRDGFARLARR